jgi:cytidylate kinase
MLRHEGIDVSEMQESLEIKEEELQEAQRKLTFYQVDYDTTKEI